MQMAREIEKQNENNSTFAHSVIIECFANIHTLQLLLLVRTLDNAQAMMMMNVWLKRTKRRLVDISLFRDLFDNENSFISLSLSLSLHKYNLTLINFDARTTECSTHLFFVHFCVKTRRDSCGYEFLCKFFDLT